MKIETIKNEFGIDINDSDKNRLEKFIELFQAYNAHTNLMSKNDLNVIYEKHIFDSLAIGKFFNQKKIEKIKLLDIGTGGGFPSIPISIVYPHIKVYAVDSIKKKISFIESAKSELDLNNLCPICARVEDLNIVMKESFDIVTSRAVADLNVILEYAVPYLKVGGYFIAYKSKIADIELSNAKRAFEVLGAEFDTKIEYNLPLTEHHQRVLIIIKKIKKTPLIYPRENGLAKKNPL